MNLRKLLIHVRDGGVGEAFSMAEFLKDCGFKSGVHVGVPTDEFTDKMTLEWYIGQGIHMVENDGWIGMNSWLNLIEKWVPEDYEVDDVVMSYFDEDLFKI